MSINWLEWLGYLASLIVLVSLLMSSLIRLRWINLVGSVLFSLYGFLIGSLPVGFMNVCIAVINIYYLANIYRTNEAFKLLPIHENTSYLGYFQDHYRKEIDKYTDFSYSDASRYDVRFFVLRDLIPAGVFLASKYDENSLLIELDFVTPEYRDFKTGEYVFEDQKSYFLEKGYSRFIYKAPDPKHINYLRKMGFQEEQENGTVYFVKSIA